MTQNKIQPDILFDSDLWSSSCPDAHRAAAWSQRIAARLFAGRYDREVERGVAVRPGSALAVHVARLASDRERGQLADALGSVVHLAAHGSGGAVTHAVPVRRAAIVAAPVAGVIDDVTVRLRGPGPVRERGVARLRLLLADGTGPLYRAGHGSLAAEIRGVLAAL
jgi:hypothetical protein